MPQVPAKTNLLIRALGRAWGQAQPEGLTSGFASTAVAIACFATVYAAVVIK